MPPLEPPTTPDNAKPSEPPQAGPLVTVDGDAVTTPRCLATHGKARCRQPFDHTDPHVFQTGELEFTLTENGPPKPERKKASAYIRELVEKSRQRRDNWAGTIEPMKEMRAEIDAIVDYLDKGYE